MLAGDEVEVLEANWTAVQVFQRCDLDCLSTMGGVLWRGIPVQSVAIVAGALNVPLDCDLLDTVRRMGAAAAKKLNERKG